MRRNVFRISFDCVFLRRPCAQIHLSASFGTKRPVAALRYPRHFLTATWTIDYQWIHVCKENAHSPAADRAQREQALINGTSLTERAHRYRLAADGYSSMQYGVPLRLVWTYINGDSAVPMRHRQRMQFKECVESIARAYFSDPARAIFQALDAFPCAPAANRLKDAPDARAPPQSPGAARRQAAPPAGRSFDWPGRPERHAERPGPAHAQPRTDAHSPPARIHPPGASIQNNALRTRYSSGYAQADDAQWPTPAPGRQKSMCRVRFHRSKRDWTGLRRSESLPPRSSPPLRSSARPPDHPARQSA